MIFGTWSQDSLCDRLIEVNKLLRVCPSLGWSFIILILLNTELLKGEINVVPVRTSKPTQIMFLPKHIFCCKETNTLLRH